MPIYKLKPATANRIAAGEVVENPASVLKELLENALDAGASRIHITIKKGGLEEISVLDNGAGIPAGEVRLAFERHATSKIKTVEDLQSINTLGFRGEALPSIASVSRMELTTCHKDEKTGSYLYLEGGVEKAFKEVAFTRGTRVTVRSLFFNTPARHKFLKGVSSETAKATRLVQNIALSRPDVSFILQRESGRILETPGDGSVLNVIAGIYGHELSKNLLPLQYDGEGMMLDGYVSSPSFTRNSRNYQVFFVNGRLVHSIVIRQCLDKSFSGAVSSRRYPAAFLYFSLPLESVDVNVHPAKTEVRFRHENQVRDFLTTCLRKTFSAKQYVPAWLVKESSLQMQVNHERKTTPPGQKNGATPQRDTGSHKLEDDAHSKKGYFQPTTATGKAALLKGNTVLSLWEGSIYDTVIGQLFSTYLLLQQGENLVILDQHAAHERILWEKICQRREEGGRLSQEVLPFTLEIPLSSAENAAAKAALLSEIGLEMEQFGNNTFIVRAVPFFIKDVLSAQLIQDIFEEILQQPLKEEEWKKETLLKLSCQAAIKAKQLLSREEIDSLLEQLKNCENPFYCPHGRPVMLKMEKKEIERMFKRRG